MKIEIGPYPTTSRNRKGKEGRKPKPRFKRKVSVEIHDSDAWSVDHTLALVIAPLLRYYRDKAGGADSTGSTDAEDFPGIGNPKESHDGERWRKLIDELVWTFERIASEDTGEQTEARVKNGLRLFGKYYQHLWT